MLQTAEIAWPSFWNTRQTQPHREPLYSPRHREPQQAARQPFFFSKTASLQLALTHAAQGTFICACESPMVAKHQFAMQVHNIRSFNLL